MAKLDRDGVKIHYEIHGSGPTLLLSHGYSSTARMWDGQIAALKDRYQVIVWDMRGHGESDYPADQSLYSEALTVGDMKALLDQVGAKKAIIAGLSLGGYMSLAFTASHPERVRCADAVRHRPGLQEGRGARQVERDGTPARRRPRGQGPGRAQFQRRGQADAPSRRLRPGAAPRAACWPRTTTG